MSQLAGRGAGYTVVVKGGSSGVKDVAGNPLAADVTASFTTTASPPPATEQYLSDLPYVGTPTNGWGPIERDRSNGEELAGDGLPLKVGTEMFAKGLGAHALSEARFAVPSGCTWFQARAGVDEETETLGSVTFEVFAGSTQLGTTVARACTQGTAPIDLDVTGRSEIRLVVGSGADNNIDFDHADWADAKLVCPPPVVTPHAPVPTIVQPVTPTAWKVGDVIPFSGTATDAEDGTLPASALSWSFVMHHCPSNCHTHPIQDFEGVASGSFTAPDHEYPSYIEMQLTATDSGGLRTTVTRRLDPRTVDLTFVSTPAGLTIAVDASTVTTPAARTVIVGSQHSVTAVTPQTSGSQTYEFSSWSDGGARTHQVTAPAAPNVVHGGVPRRHTSTCAAATGRGRAARRSRRVSPTLTFSEPMRVSSINRASISLRRGGARGPVVKTRVTYDAATDTATVDPVKVLWKHRRYVCVVKRANSGVKDVAGNPLVMIATWVFRTKVLDPTTEIPAPGGGSHGSRV